MNKANWVRQSMSLHPDILDRIKDYRFANRIESISKTAERLLVIALDCEMQKGANTKSGLPTSRDYDS